MKAVVESRTAAVNFIENTIREYQINCDFQRQPFTYFAETLNEEEEQFIKEENEALTDAGLKTELTEKTDLPFKTVKALRVKGQAQFHPLKYSIGLARKINTQCRIYENSKVIEIDEENGIVKTTRGSIQTGKIILATHTPVGVYFIHTKLAPYREFGVAAELTEGNFPGGIYWGINKPKHSIRTYVHNGKKYVMVIGDKFKTGQHGDSKKYIEGLENYIKDRLPVSSTKFIWGGQQYRSADSIPYIGKHSEKIYFLTGFATDGLTYGTLAAMIVCDQILDIPNPWEDTFKANRFAPLKSAKDFITENANTLVQYLKDTPWNVDGDSLRGIQPCEARIIEKDQQKFAVYKDETGKNHIVSAICTHMKCVVNWNASEKSWDCPCHGSRFDIDGKVIEGPAIIDLPAKKE